MRTRKISTSKLVESPVCLVPPGEERQPYTGIHCHELSDNKLCVFAGLRFWPVKPVSVEVVDHGRLDNDQVMRLQMILSYGHKVRPVCYAQHVKRYMAMLPTRTWGALASNLCCDSRWLWSLMHVPEEIGKDHLICAANAYALAKLKDWKPLVAQARTVHPIEFVSIAMAKVKDEKDAARKSKTWAYKNLKVS